MVSFKVKAFFSGVALVLGCSGLYFHLKNLFLFTLPYFQYSSHIPINMCDIPSIYLPDVSYKRTNNSCLRILEEYQLLLIKEEGLIKLFPNQTAL